MGHLHLSLIQEFHQSHQVVVVLVEVRQKTELLVVLVVEEELEVPLLRTQDHKQEELETLVDIQHQREILVELDLQTHFQLATVVAVVVLVVLVVLVVQSPLDLRLVVMDKHHQSLEPL